jgi:hypothetical protein
LYLLLFIFLISLNYKLSLSGFTCSFIGNLLLFMGFLRHFIDSLGESSYYLPISGKKWKKVVCSPSELSWVGAPLD